MSHEPNNELATLFANYLSGGIDGAVHTFQIIHDSDRSRKGRVLNGPLDQHWTTLGAWNAEGFGIYVTINETDGKGRKAKNVKRIRKLFFDNDGTMTLDEMMDALARLGLKPGWINESSPGKYHVYFNIASDVAEDLGRFEHWQKQLIHAFKGDPVCHDLPRVLRVPGFYHMKDPANPFQVAWQYHDEHAPEYSVADLEAIFGKPTGVVTTPTGMSHADQESEVPLDVERNLKRAVELCTTWPNSDGGAGGEKVMFDLAARLKDLGVSYEEAVEVIDREYNLLGRCDPLWDRGDKSNVDTLDGKVHNAYSYATENKPGSDTPEAQFGTVVDPDDVITDRQIAASSIDFDALTDDQRKGLSALADDAIDGIFGRVTVDYEEAIKSAMERRSPLMLRDFLKWMPDSNSFICIPAGSDNMWPGESVSLEVQGPPIIDKKLATKHGTHEAAKAAGLEHGLFKTDDEGNVCRYPGATCVAANPKSRVSSMTWWPGMPKVIRDVMMVKEGAFPTKGQNVFNRYLEPRLLPPPKGVTAKRWLDHVHMLYPDDAEHIIQWCAWRVQRPDVKILHALLIIGPSRIGKDSIFVPVTYAVGPHNVSNQKPLDIMKSPQFNPYLESVICYIDEARDFGESDRYEFYNHMMGFLGGVGSGVLTCADKHVKQHPVKDLVGFVYFTNPITRGVYLPPDDQRFYVAWTGLTREALCERFECNEAELHARYFLPLRQWYGDGGGNEAVAQYLATVTLDPMFPHALPRHTPAWHRIVEAHADKTTNELKAIIEAMDSPDAVSVRAVKWKASELGIYLDWDDAKGRNHVASQFEDVEYVSVQNPDDKRGRWQTGNKHKRTLVTIYAKAKLSTAEQLRAARAVYAVEQHTPQNTPKATETAVDP
jgi:hypothetical protein